MAIVLRGKKKGKTIKLSQFANDWITDQDNNVYHLTSVLFTDKEIKLMQSAQYIGSMFDEFETRNNRFYRKKKSYG
jgi:hypothetical protein